MALQVFWRLDPGYKTKTSSLPVRLHRCHQPAVSGLLPVPLLCLHVSSHHFRRPAGGGHRGSNSKKTIFIMSITTHGYAKTNCSSCQCLVWVFQSAIESLFGASMTGIAYSLFAGQPLTILGSTGPVLVFEKILFKFCK